MLLEYPDYYELFRCIGGKCEDSCCAGWEVDVDRESCEYYESIRGEFGERLRSNMYKGEDGAYFPLNERSCCPFLNSSKLCDIYIELGEEALCQVCSEYPRYFMEAGSYQQMDMSLSCIELSRIFFSRESIEYLRAEDGNIGEELNEEDEQRLVELLAIRNQCMAFLNNSPEGSKGLWSDISYLLSQLSSYIDDMGNAETKEEYILRICSGFPKRLKALEALDERWTDVLISLDAEISSGKDEDEEIYKLCREFRTGFSEHYDSCFRRLASYFIFRYTIDCFYECSASELVHLIIRALHCIELMCGLRLRARGSFDMTDMIDVAHLFSKELEHADENLQCFRSTDTAV